MKKFPLDNSMQVNYNSVHGGKHLMTVVKIDRRKQTGEKANETLKPVFSLKEHEIQNAILDLLGAEHLFAMRINTSAQVISDGNGNRRFVRSHSGGAGVADIVVFLHMQHIYTQVLWIEVKRPGSKQTPEQASFEKRVLEEGHYYLVAHDSQDVLDWLKHYGVKQ